MRNFILLFFYGILTIIGITMSACSDDSRITSLGAIYGMTVDAENTEPMRGVQVQLCTKAGSTIGSSVTYDDGHFEFADINPGEYTVIISSSKYPNVSYDFTVEAGRTSSLDIPVGLYTNPYFPIYLSSQYNDYYDGFWIDFTMPNAYSIEIIEKGVYYSQSDNPMTTGQKARYNYRSNHLYEFYGEKTTMYYVQAYVKDAKGNTYLSEIIHITEQAKAPEVKTVYITRVNATKVILEGLIEHKGNPVYTERGFIVSTDYKNPTLSDLDATTTKFPVDGVELTFKAVIDIIADTKYYIRAYAVNDGFIAYGDVMTIEDYAPIVVTGDAIEVTGTKATLMAEITNVGYPQFSERGFIVSSEIRKPTMSDISANTLKIVVEGTNLVYSKELINLTTGTQYYYRAYAKSDKFTAYGAISTFTPQEPEEFYTIGSLMIQGSDIGMQLSWSAANSMCQDSRVGGYSDWRLPNQTELEIMYNAKSQIGLSSNKYWGNYTSGSFHYHYTDMSTGSHVIATSSDLLIYARCVRRIEN